MSGFAWKSEDCAKQGAWGTHCKNCAYSLTSTVWKVVLHVQLFITVDFAMAASQNCVCLKKEFNTNKLGFCHVLNNICFPMKKRRPVMLCSRCRIHRYVYQHHFELGNRAAFAEDQGKNDVL